jgi:hypothetical protein
MAIRGRSIRGVCGEGEIENMANQTDKRWGGYIPWFFRYRDYSGAGNFLLFFERASHRIYQLLSYNELGIANLPHFDSILESKSHQVYKAIKNARVVSDVASNVRDYFAPSTIREEMQLLLHKDPEEVRFKKLAETVAKLGHFIETGSAVYALPPGIMPGRNVTPAIDPKKISEEYKQMAARMKATAEQRQGKYYRPLFSQRLGVLEVLIRVLQSKKKTAFEDFIQDLRAYFAEAEIMLDIDADTCVINPIEEQLLQKEIIDTLMPRLASRFPERAKELIGAYHDMLSGKDFGDIFIGAFKTLEELGRGITNDSKFEFDEKNLQKYFPKIHGTIRTTIVKLDAHRGDKGGHGKASPEPHEMRYLLFSICNIALLLLDYNP